MFIIERFLRWLTPYKYVDIPVRKKKERKLTPKEHLENGLLGIEVISVNSVMNSETALQRLIESTADRGYYVHNRDHHQLAIKFDPKSSKRYQYRSDAHRKQLKPIIYPKKKVYDRTHLIPIGYHGTESDNRLLVGFDSKLNRVELNKFEAKIAKINNKQAVLWFVDIQRQNDGSVIWVSEVWDEAGGLLKKGRWHDRSSFNWA